MAAVAALMTGCNKSDDKPSANAPTAQTQGGKKVVDTSKVRSDMVAAVSASKTGPPVTLKFALHQRPVVGEPVDIEIALIPVTELERLFVRFQPGPGLTLIKGGESPKYLKPATGQALEHVVTVMASNDGIFYVTAAVVADAEDSSLTRTFSIPVIAGDGVARQAPKPTAQAADAPAVR